MAYQSSLKSFFQPQLSQLPLSQSTQSSDPPPSKCLRLEESIQSNVTYHGSDITSVDLSESDTDTDHLSCTLVDVENQSTGKQVESDSISEFSENEDGDTDTQRRQRSNDGCSLDGCGNDCCVSVRDEPYHPKNVSKSKTQYGKQNRSLQNSWFNDYKWLSYCCTYNSVFSFYCRKKSTTGGFTFSTKSNNAFINGFSNWKKARQKFKEHEKSQAHRESMFSHLASTRPTVQTQ